MFCGDLAAHGAWLPPEEIAVGRGRVLAQCGGIGRMRIGLPGLPFPTPVHESQLPALRLPSPALVGACRGGVQGTKGQTQPLSDGQLHHINFIYDVLGRISARVSANGRTFGTLFVDKELGSPCRSKKK